jgi:hypothetical protein
VICRLRLRVEEEPEGVDGSANVVKPRLLPRG